MASNLITRAGTPTTQTENINKGSTLTNTELDNNFYVIYVTAGTAAAGKALVLDASGDLNMNNVGRIDNCETVQFNSEVDNGAAGSADTIVLDAGQKQKSTLDEATVTLTITEPTSVGNWILKLVGTSGSSPTITWATTGAANIYWAGGTEPTWTNDGTDLVSIYYDGSNLYCAGILDFS